MTLHLPIAVEEQLQNLATERGSDVETLVQEAVHQYLAAAALTDLTSAQVENMSD